VPHSESEAETESVFSVLVFVFGLLTGELEVNVALGVGLDVAEVTDVTLLGVGGTVVLAVGVEVGASRGTAARDVTLDMLVRRVERSRACSVAKQLPRATYEGVDLQCQLCPGLVAVTYVEAALGVGVEVLDLGSEYSCNNTLPAAAASDEAAAEVCIDGWLLGTEGGKGLRPRGPETRQRLGHIRSPPSLTTPSCNSPCQ